MLCDVKLRVQSWNNDTKSIETKDLDLGKIKDNEELTFDLVTELLMKLPENERFKLQQSLMAAKVQTLKESDIIKGRTLISNTTIDSLKEKYPEYKDAYPNILSKPEDNYILVLCNSMTINGSSYFGRTIDSEGNEVFFINGKYGTQHLLNYLDSKSKISIAFEEGKLKEDFKDFEKPLQTVAEHYGKSPEELLLDYLNNKSDYKSFKDSNGNIIETQRILNNLIHFIAGTYNPDTRKTDLQIALENIKKSSKKNKFEWEFKMDDLYEVLSFYDMTNNISKEQFSSLSEEELENILKDLFKKDPKMMRAKVKELTEGSSKEDEEKNISQIDLKAAWKQFRDQNKDIEYPTYGKLLKTPDQAKEFLTRAIQKYKPEYSSSVVTVSDEKATATYIKKGKVTGKKVILSFPWASIGDLYDFAYNTNYLFSPVNEDDVVDGEYHGGYIYKYYNEKDGFTHYAVSRHIISPKAYTNTYPNLEAAKQKIDHWNKTEKINENGLWTLKHNSSNGARPRTSKIEAKGITKGQIITVSAVDTASVSIDKMPNFFKDLFNGTVQDVQEAFKGFTGIESINSPEKAASFILNTFKLVKGESKSNKFTTNSLQQLIKVNKEGIEKIISEINAAKKISYQVEKLDGNIAVLKYLQNNGNNVSIDGKINGNPANNPTVSDMTNAINYFNEIFGINIKTFTKEDLIQNNNIYNIPENQLKLVRAFVYNGDIHINTSNADLSDLFHEMSHIFLGLLKAKYPDGYQKIITKYMSHNKFKDTLNYINIAYKNFAQQDKIEEAVVNLIAREMFNRGYLVNEFKNEEFIRDFEKIFEFQELAKSSGNQNMFDIRSFRDTLATKENMSKMEYNMKISQAIKALIESKKIKEFC